MKLELKMIVVLFSVSVASAALLSYVYTSTKPVIEKNNLKKEKEALQFISPDADTFIKVELEKDTFFYCCTHKEDTIGLIFQIAPHGYGGPIKIMVGLKKDTTISRIRIAGPAEGLKETPGLGMNITEKSFQEQFSGKKEKEIFLKKDKKAGTIDAITAATISSRAVTNGIREGVKRFSKYLK